MRFTGIQKGAALLFGALVFHACGGAETPEGPTPAPTPVATPNFPVLVAAGDISCDSATPQLPCKSRETSDIMMSLRALHSSVTILPLGDLQYDSGTLPEYQKNYHTTWGRLNPNAHPVPGNHEYQTARASGYFEYFTSSGVAVGARDQGWYAYEVGEWHFIALNSNCGSIGGCNVGSAQHRWLQSDLAANTKKCTVAYMHHPFISTGSNGGTAELLPLISLLYLNKVDILLTGHDHDYERFVPMTPEQVPDAERGLRLFVVGTGGRDLVPFVRTSPLTSFRTSDHFGALKIVMKDGGYEWAFINTSNVTIDPGQSLCF